MNRNISCILHILLFLAICYGHGQKKRVLNSQQKILVDELREKLSRTNNNYLKEWNGRTSDGILWNWIENYSNNIERTKTSLNTFANWRKRNDVDNARSWAYSVEEELALPFAVTGFNDDGEVVIVHQFGRWDVRNLLRSRRVDTKKVANQFVRMWEWGLTTKNPSTGEYPDNMIYIVDFDGFTVGQVTSIRAIQTAVTAAYAFISKYPLYDTRSILFRDPPYFQIMWAAVRSVIRGKALARFTLTGELKASWQTELEKSIPPRAMPSYLGTGGQAKVNFLTHVNDN